MLDLYNLDKINFTFNDYVEEIPGEFYTDKFGTFHAGQFGNPNAIVLDSRTHFTEDNDAIEGYEYLVYNKRLKKYAHIIEYNDELVKKLRVGKENK